jgi:hypothetical protein
MLVMLIKRETTIEVRDHKDLRKAWKLYGGPDTLVGRFVVRKPLTDAQFRRLPKALRAMIECRSGDGVEWLRNLWNLPDTRDGGHA